MLTKQGDLSGALSAYRDSLAIIERLLATNPSNPRWQRHIGASHENIGTVLEKQGNFAAALQAYRNGLAIVERLVELSRAIPTGSAL